MRSGAISWLQYEYDAAKGNSRSSQKREPPGSVSSSVLSVGRTVEAAGALTESLQDVLGARPGRYEPVSAAVHPAASIRG